MTGDGATAILVAYLLGRAWPPPGVAGTPHNRALRDAIAADIASLPPGMIVDIPAG